MLITSQLHNPNSHSVLPMFLFFILNHFQSKSPTKIDSLCKNLKFSLWSGAWTYDMSSPPSVLYLLLTLSLLSTYLAKMVSSNGAQNEHKKAPRWCLDKLLMQLPFLHECLMNEYFNNYYFSVFCRRTSTVTIMHIVLVISINYLLVNANLASMYSNWTFLWY